MNDDYMISFQNETKQTIEASYKKMTAVERSVADFFIGNKDDMDFSSKNISRVLYVSEATLSRFSQKCGYKGYREFIFSYERDLKFEQKSEGTEKDVGLFARRVQNSYQKLLQENFRILDEEQVRRVAGMLNISKRVLIFGIGNSGYAAEEFQLRFMRIGMDVNAVTDSHMMKIGAALAGEETLVIAITLSGETAEVLEYLHVKNPEEKLAEMIKEIKTENAGTFAEKLMEHVMLFTGGHALDDMTIVVSGIWEK